MPLPNGRKALGGKWIFKRKFTNSQTGPSIRYKARWVAKGYLQRHGIDFDQTWASIVKPMTYKALFAWATANNWYIRQGDVKTAFLNGEITENVYVEQFTGYVSALMPNGTVLACKLKRALYGLK
jgi:hypothetical protein